MSPAFTYNNFNFSGVTSIGEHLLMSQIENNIKSFLDWGLLNIGGFINVLRPQNNIFGNPIYKLKPTEDPNFTTGQVWQTMRKDWVWEQDIVFVDKYNPLLQSTPTLITGIYVNNVFYPLNTVGQYSYKVDYINSRIIFNSPISTSAEVGMEYSYRWVQVYTYDNARWWQQLQYKTDQNINHFNQLAEGDFSILSNNRVQLPAIIVETISRGMSEPYQLGDKSLIVKQELLLHIVAETMHDRNMMIDILRLQQDKFIKLYDTNVVLKNGVYPFNIDGSLNNNRLQYDELINDEDYYWKTARLIDIFASDVQSFSPFLSESNVKLTVEIIFGVDN
jgi:hypothetical protein